MSAPTVAALAAAISLTAAAPAAAKPIHYQGKTDGGSRISFTRTGNKIGKINALVPTTCVSPDSKTPRCLQGQAACELLVPGTRVLRLRRPSVGHLHLPGRRFLQRPLSGAARVWPQGRRQREGSALRLAPA